MATDSALKSVTNTLSTTVADRITLTQLWPAVEVTNHDVADFCYVLCDGTATPTAVAQANNTTVVPPGTTKLIRVSPAAPDYTTIVLSIVGDGGIYSVEGAQ